MSFTGPGISGCRPKSVVSTTRLSTAQSQQKSQLIRVLLMKNCHKSNPCDFVRFVAQGPKSCLTASSSITIIWAIVIRSANSLSISSTLSKDPLPVWPGLQPRVISAAGTALSAGRHTAEKHIFICWPNNMRKSRRIDVAFSSTHWLSSSMV